MAPGSRRVLKTLTRRRSAFAFCPLRLLAGLSAWPQQADCGENATSPFPLCFPLTVFYLRLVELAALQLLTNYPLWRVYPDFKLGPRVTFLTPVVPTVQVLSPLLWIFISLTWFHSLISSREELSCNALHQTSRLLPPMPVHEPDVCLLRDQNASVYMLSAACMQSFSANVKSPTNTGFNPNN